MAEQSAGFWVFEKIYAGIVLESMRKEIEPKETPNARVNVMEMDELYSFVERKNKIYAITLGSQRHPGNRRVRQKSRANLAFSRSLHEGASVLL